MYRTMRYIRIAIALIAMAVPTWALLAGYDSVFVRMQILTSLMTGVVAVLLFWAVVTIIYGRIYCSTVCPLGTLMDCAGAAERLVRKGKNFFRYCEPAPKTQFAFLLLLIVSVLSGSALLPTLLDPYSAYARIVTELIGRPLGLSPQAVAFSLSAFSIAVVTAMAVALVSWRRGRLICNTACPLGTVMGMGSRRAVFHMEIDPDRCTNCGLCERSCKAECIKIPEKIIDTGRCVVCFDCAAVCPVQALTYKSGRYRLDMPLMQPTGGSSSNLNTPDK